jgi:hypothetical protein
MVVVTGMSATDRKLSDACKRQLVAALGQAAANEVEVGLETSAGIVEDTGGQTLADPTLVGSICIGNAADTIGFYGSGPTGQPAGMGQAPVGALTTQPMSFVGTPDLILGDTGNPDLNNQMASVAQQINNAATDLNDLRTLVNALREGLVTLGLIKGGSLKPRSPANPGG